MSVARLDTFHEAPRLASRPSRPKCTRLRPWTAVLLAGLLAPFCPARQTSADPPQGLFLDQWEIVLINGQRAGHTHRVRTRTGERVESTETSTMRIARAGTEVRITTRDRHLEALDGTPLSYSHEEESGGEVVRRTGTIRDGRVAWVTAQGRSETRGEAPWPREMLLSWGIECQERRHPLTAGTAYELVAFEPQFGPEKPLRHRCRVAGPEKTRLPDGTEIDTVRVDTTVDAGGAEFTVHDWIDGQRQVARGITELAGMKIETLRSTREEAERDNGAAEVFLDTLIAVRRSIDAGRTRTLVLDITLPRGEQLEFPRTEMQSVDRRNDSYRLTIRRIPATDLRDATATRDGAEARRGLAPSVYADGADAAIRALADEALGGGAARSDYQTVDTLRRFVSRAIRTKSLGVGFGSASDVARSREGDCTEHAVLLAALCRARDIPARGVLGIVYVPAFQGRKDVFGFHMWTQVLLANRWIDVDAALNQTEVDPTHVALAITALDDQSTLGPAMLQLLKAMGGMKIEIVAAE
ncbi:MAG: hypothetical protein CHACPFDD_03613 [Phycisphaerae bacterium]|nr:hypothetical protein [Phycisphaerae bacterium]